MIIELEISEDKFQRLLGWAKVHGLFKGDPNQAVVDYLHKQIDLTDQYSMTVEYCKCPYPSSDSIHDSCAECGLTVRIYNND